VASALAACSFPTKSAGVADARLDGHGGDGTSEDGRAIDAAPDGPPPPVIAISGTVVAVSAGSFPPVSGTSVTVVSRAGSDLATTTSDGSGNFSMSVATNGATVDAYLHASGGSGAFLDTFVWPPAPLSADDAGVTVEMLSVSELQSIAGLCGASQNTSDALIAVQTLQGGNPVTDATVTSTPAPGSTCSLSALEPGVTALFDVPPGPVTVSATGSGTFLAHSLNAVGVTLTTTQIIEE
jgi:hypothetical protein